MEGAQHFRNRHPHRATSGKQSTGSCRVQSILAGSFYRSYFSDLLDSVHWSFLLMGSMSPTFTHRCCTTVKLVDVWLCGKLPLPVFAPPEVCAPDSCAPLPFSPSLLHFASSLAKYIPMLFVPGGKWIASFMLCPLSFFLCPPPFSCAGL